MDRFDEMLSKCLEKGCLTIPQATMIKSALLFAEDLMAHDDIRDDFIKEFGVMVYRDLVGY